MLQLIKDNVYLVSDIHFERCQDPNNLLNALFPESNQLDRLNGLHNRTLILAGDIIELRSSYTIDIFKWVCSTYKNVIYVLGNHESYYIDFKTTKDIVNSLRSQFNNLYVLSELIDFYETTIDDQHYVGATMWFPSQPNNNFFNKLINDFDAIDGYIPQVYELNSLAVENLNRLITSESIVITHHLPSFRSIPEKYKRSPNNCFFVCDMEEVIAIKKPQIWIHGHTHDRNSYKFFDTEIICNAYRFR